MSHELRTPLHVILGYGDLLLAGEFGSLAPQQAEVVRGIGARGRELQRSDRQHARPEPARSGERRSRSDRSRHRSAAEVDEETRRDREEAGLPLEIEATAPSLDIRSDPTKLKVVLKNLIGNAFKFTPSGGVRVMRTRRGAASR